MSSAAEVIVVLLANSLSEEANAIRQAIFACSKPVRVLEVSDGEHALQLLRGDRPYHRRSVYPIPSMVVLDVALPEINGVEVLRWIREESNFPNMIVLLMTDSAEDREIERAYEYHANSVLHKHPLLQLPEACANVFSYWLDLNEAPRFG